MAVEPRAAPTDPEGELFDDLHAALAEHAHSHDAVYRAGALLVKHYDDRQLIGLVDDAQRAVYYSGLTRCIAKADFDAKQVHLSQATPLGQGIDDPERWVEYSDLHWNWLHPEFR